MRYQKNFSKFKKGRYFAIRPSKDDINVGVVEPAIIDGRMFHWEQSLKIKQGTIGNIPESILMEHLDANSRAHAYSILESMYGMPFNDYTRVYLIELRKVSMISVAAPKESKKEAPRLPVAYPMPEKATTYGQKDRFRF